ncbi:MAG: hypothetical protein QOH30_4270 [Baekduia sp.]|jgi:hypothetical protein|nr:hypothetical protein [Baekduia sp.]
MDFGNSLARLLAEAGVLDVAHHGVSVSPQ